jgi:hypothetical protein
MVLLDFVVLMNHSIPGEALMRGGLTTIFDFFYDYAED